MPKARSTRRTSKTHSRVDPTSKKRPDNNKTKAAKDPKASHLYTDDNPSTTLHGTGFKDAATAKRTLELVSQRSLTYQFQTINTMFYRAKNHPYSHGNEDMEAAMDIFRAWLHETYPRAKASRPNFKPLLKKETVNRYLSRLQESEDVDARFAQVYVALPKGKRLANILVDENHPEQRDWEREREENLVQLTQDYDKNSSDDQLWDNRGHPATWLLRCIAWAWSPTPERRL